MSLSRNHAEQKVVVEQLVSSRDNAAMLIALPGTDTPRRVTWQARDTVRLPELPQRATDTSCDTSQWPLLSFAHVVHLDSRDGNCPGFDLRVALQCAEGGRLPLLVFSYPHSRLHNEAQMLRVW